MKKIIHSYSAWCIPFSISFAFIPYIWPQMNSMFAYVKSKASLITLYHSGTSLPALFERQEMAAAVFNFITFEEEDFENKEATILSFNIVSDLLYVTLKTGDNLDNALAAIKELNPHVLWELGALNFIDHPSNNSVLVKQQLRIIEIL